MNKKLIYKNLKRLKRKFFPKLNFKPILNLRFYFLFKKHRKEWLNQGGTIDKNDRILGDFNTSSGLASGHYFHQDLLVAKMIYEDKPYKHLDVGSRVDGFVAHVASYREIEVLDIRPQQKSKHENIKFIKADLMNPQELPLTDSLSCLHVIEHFGLGRYNDPININGHIEGLNNLIKILQKNGRLYISFPIGIRDEVHFNNQRIIHPKSILSFSSIKENMELKRFDYVDDKGDLHLDINLHNFQEKLIYGCGIYTFIKK